MKPIIDTSYFVDEINIPGTDKPAVAEVLDGIIKKRQSWFIKHVVGGDDLYWPIKEAIEASEREVDPIPLDPHIVNLMNGMETRDYTHVGVKQLFANWVYHRYMGKSQTETTTTGESSAKKTNAARASAIYKMVDVWNEMCDQSIAVRNYLKDPYFDALSEIPDPGPVDGCFCCFWKNSPAFQKENILNI